MPLRAFQERVRARRGNRIAAVAVARKPAILIWHTPSNGKDHARARPALMAHKMRALELAAGPSARRGASCDHNFRRRRHADRAPAERAANVHRGMALGRRKAGPRRGVGAADEARP